MKTCFLITLIFLSQLSFSQRSMDFEHENFFRIGAKAGVNINKIHGKSYKEGFSYDYLLGGFMQFNFSQRLGIQPEVNFTQSSSKFTDASTDIYDDLFTDGSQKKVNLSYIKVPVLLNINIGPSKRVKLQVGPQVGGLLKQKADSLNNNGNLYKKSDWSAVGGLWIQIPFINLGARYELGLSNINDFDTREKWRSQGFILFAGITF
ncbi:MAG: porin family protein [Ginsengibacter sp.]